MNALDINKPIPKEKRSLVSVSKLALDYDVSEDYVRKILQGDRNINTSVAKAIKEKAIKIINAIEEL